MPKLSDTTGDFRQLCTKLFAAIKKRTGTEPQYWGHDWYKVSQTKIFLVFHLHGERARKYPPCSVRLQTPWDDDFNEDAGVRYLPNALWNNPAAEVCINCQEGETVALSKILAFIEKALERHKARSGA